MGNGSDILSPISVPTPFLVGPVNCLLYRGEALTLFDTGPRTDDAWEALNAGLAAEGVTIRDLERVVLTHHHIDHCGLLARVVEVSGAETWAHPDVVMQSRLGDGEDGDGQRKVYYYALMSELGVPAEEAGQSMQLWDAFKDMIDPFEIEHTLADGAELDGFMVAHVPGHSSTDTLFVHRNGFSVVGDHILESMNPNPLLRRPNPGEERGRALVEFRASLRRARSLPLGTAYPGHGTPIADAVPVIDGLLAQHDKRNQRIMEAMPEEGITPYQLARVLYPQLEMPHLYLGLSVAAGQLEVLEEEGLLQSVRDDAGRLIYRR
jgi:glyoxylase-like metal-dependent hydrolase (beta-lactamase superfamily II)